MKKMIFTIAFAIVTLGAFAQVGIGTTAPTATLDVVGANSATTGALDAKDGVIVPRVTTNMTNTTVTGTTVGQLVYSTHTNSTGFYYWNVSTTGTSSWLPIVDGDAWAVTGEDTTSAIGRTGNVGIGIAVPTKTLDVNGTVKVRTFPNGAATDDLVTSHSNGELRNIDLRDIVINQRISSRSATNTWNNLNFGGSGEQICKGTFVGHASVVGYRWGFEFYYGGSSFQIISQYNCTVTNPSPNRLSIRPNTSSSSFTPSTLDFNRSTGTISNPFPGALSNVRGTFFIVAY